MDIDAYNKLRTSSIGTIDSVNRVRHSNSESVVTRIQAVKEVMPGFNPATLYLVKLAKALRNKDKQILKGKKIKDMNISQFKEFILSLQDDFLNDENSFSRDMKDEQILLMQDLLSSVEEDGDMSIGALPVVIDDDISIMNANEFRKFLLNNKEMIIDNGLIYINYEELSNIEDTILLEYKQVLLSRLNEVKDLFYYNKALIGYEKSYNSIAEIVSNGLEA